MKRVLIVSLELALMLSCLFYSTRGILAWNDTDHVDTENWPTYTHPIWGVTFRYHPDWVASIPNFDNLGAIPEGEAELGYYDSSVTPEQDQFARTLGHVISLRPQDDKGWGNAVIYVGIAPFTLSPQGSLEDWVNTKQQWSENVGLSTDSLELHQLDPDYTPKNFDQVIYSIQNGRERFDTIWVARQGIVYSIEAVNSDSRVIELINQLAASLEFDSEKQTVLRQEAKFNGDETELRQFIDRMMPIEKRETSAEQNASASAVLVTPSGLQKALPANWISPVASAYSSAYTSCNSTAHAYGDASEFAVDVGMVIDTSVFAMRGGYVEFSGNYGQGYGNLVLLSTSVTVAGVGRTYYHAYGHLNLATAIYHSTVNISSFIGYSGNTGNSSGPHLHFHIRDVNYAPVDSTPVLGFRPTLDYPRGTNCGELLTSFTDDVIIESYAYREVRQQGAVAGGSAKTWDQIYNPTSAIVENYYMRAMPDTEAGFDPPVVNIAPEFRYDVELRHTSTPQTFYVWTCGDSAGDGRDDTVHMGVDNVAISTLSPVKFSLSGWAWVSDLYNVPDTANPPYFSDPSSGAATVNVWMREDGTRFSRLILTRTTGNPTGGYRCGGY